NVSPANSGSITFSAASNAMSGSAQVTITGVSGSQTASVNLSVNVVQMATPIAMPFITLGGGIQSAFFDEARQLLFATNLYLNEVDVLSGQNLTLKTRIPVAQPFGIDQMPDGKTLVVGTATQGVYT